MKLDEIIKGLGLNDMLVGGLEKEQLKGWASKILVVLYWRMQINTQSKTSLQKVS